MFLAHRSELQAYLTRKLHNADVAAELTQETFLRFAEHSGGTAALTPITHDRSYLYRVAHNLAVDYVRGQKRENIDSIAQDRLADIPDDAPSPEQTVSGQSELLRLQQILLELPERTRQTFVLNRIHLHTYRETAERLEISESSVQKHLARAVKHVMQRLRAGQAGEMPEKTDY